MAEAIGVVASAISIAGLFRACIEAFELIKAAQSQDLDFHKAVLKLNIEKCRLYTWGEAMGLTIPACKSQPRPLDSFEFKPLVIETLRMLLRLFSDTSKLQDRYGCKADTAATTSNNLTVLTIDADHIGNLSTCFSNFKFNSGEADKRIKKKLRWLVHDRTKFPALVSDVKDFIDGLQDITKSISPIALQTRTTAQRIQQINQPETLQLVADVCETDHPALSDAASIKLEIVSMAQTQRDEIALWNENIETPEDVFSGVESLTITELKHRLLKYMAEEANPVRSSLASQVAEAQPPSKEQVQKERASPQANQNEDFQSNYQVGQSSTIEIDVRHLQSLTDWTLKVGKDIPKGTGTGELAEAIKSLQSLFIPKSNVGQTLSPTPNSTEVLSLSWEHQLNRALDQLWHDPLADVGGLLPSVDLVDQSMGPNNAFSVYLLLLQAYRKVAQDEYEASKELCAQVQTRMTELLKTPKSIDQIRVGSAYRRLGRLQDTKERYGDAHRSFQTALKYVQTDYKLSRSVLMEICDRQKFLAGAAKDDDDEYLWAQILEKLEQQAQTQTQNHKQRSKKLAKKKG